MIAAAIPEHFRDATFESYQPKDAKREVAIELLRSRPQDSFFLWGDYGRGKTYLAFAQFRALMEAGQCCAFRSVAELLSELRDAEIRDETSIVLQRVRYAESFHLFIDDVDKFKGSEFKSEVLFNLLDSIYKRKLGLTITSNYCLAALMEFERLEPAIVSRIDRMCRVIEV